LLVALSLVRAQEVFEGFELDKAAQLTFERGEIVRRQFVGGTVDALRCEGRHCGHVSMPKSATCTNTFTKDEAGRSWECTASEALPGGYIFDSFDINCELVQGSTRIYHIGSCRLIYTLRHPNAIVDAHDHPETNKLAPTPHPIFWLEVIKTLTPMFVCGFLATAGVIVWLNPRPKSKGY